MMHSLNITEEQYDEVMREAKKAFEYQESIGNPYAFHKAFEKAQRDLNMDQPMHDELLHALYVAYKSISSLEEKQNLFIPAKTTIKETLKKAGVKFETEKAIQ